VEDAGVTSSTLFICSFFEEEDTSTEEDND